MTRASLLRHAWVQAALWVVIAVLANHIASAWFLRVDLTQDRRYSLSPAAKASVLRLQRPLVASVYITEGLEAPYNNHRQAVVEKLEELRAWSGGQLEIRVTDPTDDDVAQVEAERFGIQPVQYRYRDSSRREIKQVWLGVSFTYGERQQVVDPIATLETLEYELTRAIRAVTTEADERLTVGFTQGHGEPDLSTFPAENPLGQLREQLSADHDLVSVVLGGDEGVPEEVDALLVIGPQQSVSARARFQLDQYLMGGGPVAWFLSGVRPDWRAYRTTEVRHGLHPQLAHYGVSLGRSVLVDRHSNEIMNLPVLAGRRRQMVAINYPLIPVSRDMSASSPAVRGLDRLVLPFATPVSLSPALPPERMGSVWASSGPRSVALERYPSLNPTVLMQPTEGELEGPFPVAVAITGVFESWFADRPVPPPPGRSTPLPEDEVIAAGARSRLVVVGSADFTANNHAFVLNTVDWMLQDDALIDIRSRDAAVAELSAPEAPNVWKYKAAMGGIPLVVLLAAAALGLSRGRQ